MAFADGLFDQVDGAMILVGGDFVTNQVPDTFLGVEFRMIRWQVFEFDVGMGVEELLNAGAFVPGSPIDVEIDLRFLDSIAEVF